MLSTTYRIEYKHCSCPHIQKLPRKQPILQQVCRTNRVVWHAIAWYGPILEWRIIVSKKCAASHKFSVLLKKTFSLFTIWTRSHQYKCRKHQYCLNETVINCWSLNPKRLCARAGGWAVPPLLTMSENVLEDHHSRVCTNTIHGHDLFGPLHVTADSTARNSWTYICYPDGVKLRLTSVCFPQLDDINLLQCCAADHTQCSSLQGITESWEPQW